MATLVNNTRTTTTGLTNYSENMANGKKYNTQEEAVEANARAYALQSWNKELKAYVERLIELNIIDESKLIDCKIALKALKVEAIHGVIKRKSLEVKEMEGF